MADHLTYQQVLAEVYEENAKNLLVTQTEYEEDVEADDTHPDELDQQEDFQKVHGSRQIVEVPTSTPIYKDYTTQSIRHNKDVQTRVLNVDSRYRQDDPNSSETDFLFKLINPVKNVLSVRISSLELPNTFYNFSKRKGNIYMRVYYPSGQTQTYRELMFDGPTIFNPSQTTTILGIPEGNYLAQFNQVIGTPDSTELANITTLLEYLLNIPNDPTLNPNDTLGTASTFRVTLVPISMKLVITYTGGSFDIDFITHSPFIQRQYDWGLGFNLGFRNKTYSGYSTYTSEAIPDVIGHNYLFLSLDPDWKVITHAHPDREQLFSFAKIVVDVPKNDVIYDDGSNTVTKEYTLSQPTDIHSFPVRLTDQYEERIDLVGANISFTLELKEVMNPAVYEYVRHPTQPT